jgi:hypothetical protein
MDISCQVPPALLIGACDGYCQRALVGEAAMIRTQMGENS